MASKQRSKRIRWITIGTVVAAAVVGISLLNIGDDIVFFLTPAEARAQASDLDGKLIRVGGMVKPGSVQWEAESLSLKFVMSDLKEIEIAVNHVGTPPDLFKEGAGVVVEGRIDQAGGLMQSQNLMVKHSEEYKKPDSTHHSIDRALLEQSLFK